MITREAVKREMRHKNIKCADDPPLLFFEDIVDWIDQVHQEGPKPWQEDAEVTYKAWQWDLIRARVAALPVPKLFVIVGLAQVWDFPEPWDYQGMGDEPVGPTDIPGTLRLRLAFAVDKVALRLFHSGGLHDERDRR